MAFVGTLEPRKGIAPLVAAFDRVADHHPDAVLVLGGQLGWGLAAGGTSPGRCPPRQSHHPHRLPARCGGAGLIAPSGRGGLPGVGGGIRAAGPGSAGLWSHAHHHRGHGHGRGGRSRRRVGAARRRRRPGRRPRCRTHSGQSQLSAGPEGLGSGRRPRPTPGRPVSRCMSMRMVEASWARSRVRSCGH